MLTKPYHPVVLDLIERDNARHVLDAPCGTGWLGYALRGHADRPVLDGLGLYEFPEGVCGYRNVTPHDLNQPAPDLGGGYDAVVCGEAIHLLANPGVMLESFKSALKPGGRLVITTPNSWSPGSRLRYLFRGFHAGFAPSEDRRIGEDYITYFPFHFGQLHLLLRHYGYESIEIHPVIEPKPVRWTERALAASSRRYYAKQLRHAQTDAAREYWRNIGSDASVFGRWLVVSARVRQA